ncbi:NACHT, LRR and PYD domains-containing protein 4E-like [Gouania willdenowi]|uniref:NACHT, LRR and PYD domains-containing protein 4E-like n=1 Tax=Gouania willdenowi TaxID=441366 RepID=A0A8C5D313_GOUWI|nr:NACHT, LRR and PYD domains-containing protein 4E-like [Gouania willdenowi]
MDQEVDTETLQCGEQTQAQRTMMQHVTAGQASGPEPGLSCGSKISEESPEKHIDVEGALSPETQYRVPVPKPVPSCWSCKSNASKDLFVEFKGKPSAEKSTLKQYTRGPGPEIQVEPGSPLSCDSCQSDASKDIILEFPRQTSAEKCDQSMGKPVGIKQERPTEGGHLPSFEVFDDVHTESQQCEDNPIFTLLEKNIVGFVKTELKKFSQILDGDDPQCSEGHDKKLMRSNRESFLKIALYFLKEMKQEKLADLLQSKLRIPRCRQALKSNLKEKFQDVYEGVARAGKPTLLEKIFTEVYITEGGSGEVNQEHEVRQIETASWRSDAAETAITLEELFKAPPGRPRPIRTVMTKGVAGIGKTLLTHKFTVDWAEDKAQQEVHFTFPLTFRELNVLRGRSFSLVGLIHHFFSETKEAGIHSFQDFLVLFILDGLDECRLPLDFLSTQTLTDVSESTSVEVLLINLIRGKLLPSARLWITTRPAAANQIPPECVDMVTEVRGFTDPQKDEYFRRRSTDEEQVSRIMSHIRTCRSLHIMCHIPLFCWITDTVLEDVLKSREEGELPRTLTQIYSHYVVLQTKVKNVKFDGGAPTDPHWTPESKKMMETLAKLAFDQLLKGNLIFYESDLTECGMDLRAASMCSGVFTQVFREEGSLYQDKVFTFIHLSFQEFLAALHIHLNFNNSVVNLLKDKQCQKPSKMSQSLKNTLNHLHQSAVDEALRSPNGHLDLFLRFLLGLSLPTNQRLLQGLLTQIGIGSQSNQETVKYIKEKLDKVQSVERSINLLHCLNELNDRSLLEQIQHSMISGHLSTKELSPAQWSALVFILLSSEEHLQVFDLRSYSPSEDTLLKLLPVIKASKKAVLSFCGLSERSCTALSSVLSSQSSCLKHLNLSNNELEDSGVELLCEGLKSPHCKLETLSLSGCLITAVGCASLSSALSMNPSTLKDLDLSNNDLQDSGVKLLCEGLKSPQCKLETLSLSGCLVMPEGCLYLASALTPESCLKNLDLTYNNPGNLGVKLLSGGPEDPTFRLETLSVDHGGERRIRPGLRKYFCHIELDMNSVHRNLLLSEDRRTVREVEEEQPYPDHPHRFDYCYQALSSTELTGRCYWEVEWMGIVYVAVTYGGISRKGDADQCVFGCNNQSWSLSCFRNFYSVKHENTTTATSCPCPSSCCGRVGVYVDYPAGRVSFYEVSSDSLRHIHTFSTTFTQPLFAGCWIRSSGSSVSLCPLTEAPGN